MVEVIPLKFGVTFKQVLSQPDIFTAFVSHDRDCRNADHNIFASRLDWE